MNVAYVYTEMRQLEDAGAIMNKTIVLMERLDTYYKAEPLIYQYEITLSQHQMLLV